MDRERDIPLRRSWTRKDLSTGILEGRPAPGFDCGGEEQNTFLYEHAWADQQAWVSTTYLFFVRHILAGFATVLLDSFVLGRKERPEGVRFRQVPAVQLGQLGVDRRFAGSGLGGIIVGFAGIVAREVGKTVACRFLTVDARPDLVAWYERQGFQRNNTMQVQRIEDAARFGRKAEDVAVSMRFDLI